MNHKDLEIIQKYGIKILTLDHPHYPTFLKMIPDAPPLIYAKGETEILSQPSISLVGTRTPTTYGLRSARNLSRDLAEVGLVTVSGLARGIDTAVHEATLRAGGSTIAVLGGGLLDLYPPENKNLSEQIARQGVVISEFPLYYPPEAWCFPKRNRIISALSYGTVVIEGDIKSGSMITAKLALEQGKDVFAVPGPMDSKFSGGPNRLIQQGAKLVLGIEDILEEIQPLKEKFYSKISARTSSVRGGVKTATPKEQGLLNFLSVDPLPMDHLMVKTGLPVGEISKTLLDLEIKGVIQSLPGRRYVRI